jgi:lipid II:glycine glycyltransferase (peptidoglycan interpeptide bridge formation enzyme)
VVAAFKEHLAGVGVRRAVVTPPLAAHGREPQDTFLFAMLHQGFRIANSDVTSIVSLRPEVEAEVFTSRARNMARKAETAGITCTMRAPLGDFWPLMEKTFDRLGVTPTHTEAQWQWLMERLPDSVWVDLAYLGDRPVAGIGRLKVNSLVDSSFYLCSDPKHQETQALTLLIARSIAASAKAGFRWFDFGTSSVDMVPRENLFRFKESFGALGLFRHRLEADLA